MTAIWYLLLQAGVGIVCLMNRIQVDRLHMAAVHLHIGPASGVASTSPLCTIVGGFGELGKAARSHSQFGCEIR
jgi:hypothetical protein